MAKQITKTYLEYLGVTEVTPDGRIFTQNGELKSFCTAGRATDPYRNKRFKVWLHDTEKYKSVPKEKRNTNSGRVRISVYQVVYAWFHGEVPYGKEIHHRNGNHLDNSIDNLVALTHAEHVKEHQRMRELERQEAIVEEKCRLDIPREHYVKKIDEYMAKGDYANANQYKRRLKYYDNHIEEAAQKIKDIKDRKILEQYKQMFKEAGNKGMWHQMCKVIKQWDTFEQIQKDHVFDTLHRFFDKYGVSY